MINNPEDVVWVEIDEDGVETGVLVDFTEDERLYEVNEIDTWDGCTYILKMKTEL